MIFRMKLSQNPFNLCSKKSFISLLRSKQLSSMLWSHAGDPRCQLWVLIIYRGYLCIVLDAQSMKPFAKYSQSQVTDKCIVALHLPVIVETSTLGDGKHWFIKSAINWVSYIALNTCRERRGRGSPTERGSKFRVSPVVCNFLFSVVREKRGGCWNSSGVGVYNNPHSKCCLFLS